MVHDTFTTARHLSEAEALALLPSGSTIQSTNDTGWCVIALNVEEQAARAFADFCWPMYIFDWRNGPVVLLRRSNLATFCGLWETWA
jgi:hypothetical protein